MKEKPGRKRAIVLMFDSLNRHWLSAYGGGEADTPNFRRLADRTVTFDTAYVCSMPCMPARRDFHTARPNFLHTSWGPMEPYDDSIPEMLKNAGVYTHLSTDHYHYWEDGGATYHSRYNSYDLIRGQEGDSWKGEVADPVVPENINGKGRRQDWVNRKYMEADADHFQTKTLDAGMEFLETNHKEDRWALTIECFDPHEPFYVDDAYRTEKEKARKEPIFDWPGYCPVTESEEEIERCRDNYRALLRKCDESLGRVLDFMDQNDMWEDTMLVVWTDHGYFLGEHNAWAKNWLPLYEEVGHVPLFLWDPDSGVRGERREALVQPSLDLGPTLLDYFGLQKTPHMTGHSLRPVCVRDEPVRETAIFGYFGDRINVTDGRYVYFRAPRPSAECELNHYRLMPTQMRGFFSTEALSRATLSDGFAFTKGAKVLCIPEPVRFDHGHAKESRDHLTQSVLYDVKEDPGQKSPLSDPEVEQRLIAGLKREMERCEAPPEQFHRVGL